MPLLVFSMQRRIYWFMWIGAVLCGIMALSRPVHAHKVNLFAYVEGDKIVVEGYFSKTRKARDCRVHMYDMKGRQLSEGTTDPKGICTFALPNPTDRSGGLKFVLKTGDGHRAEYALAANEMPASGTTTQPQSPKVQQSVPEAPRKPSLQAGSQAGLRDLVNLVQELRETVKKQNRTIVTMLGNQQRLLGELRERKPDFRDILGGIGWILGIMGIAAYAVSRYGAKGK